MAAAMRNGLGYGLSPLFIAIAVEGALKVHSTSPRILGFIK
jgi:hypothetical protein